MWTSKLDCERREFAKSGNNSKCSICALRLVAVLAVLILQLVLRDANKRAEVMLGQERASGAGAAGTMTRVGTQIIGAHTNIEQRLHATGKPGGREPLATSCFAAGS